MAPFFGRSNAAPLRFMKTFQTIKITPKESGRLDKFLAGRFDEYSRSFFQQLIKERGVLVDDHPVGPDHKLKVGQTVRIEWPKENKEEAPVKAGPLPFPILFEDDDIIVINKPPNLLVHPAGSERKGETLVELLRPKLRSRKWPDAVRPGLIHRLDRDTSGVLVFAKTPGSHNRISKQFANRQVKKTYVGLVKGIPPDKEGTIDGRIARHLQKRQRFAVTGDGRQAITRFRVAEELGGRASYLELKPLTGRTHQIRVHLAHYGFPILGDEVYGGNQKGFEFVPRQMLHARHLQFAHPKTGKTVQFEAAPPKDFNQVLKILRSPKQP